MIEQIFEHNRNKHKYNSVVSNILLETVVVPLHLIECVSFNLATCSLTIQWLPECSKRSLSYHIISSNVFFNLAMCLLLLFKLLMTWYHSISSNVFVVGTVLASL